MSKVNGKDRVRRQHLSSGVHIAFLALFLLLQIGSLLLAFYTARQSFAHFYLVCEIISLCVVLYIVREDSNSSYKIPWIIINLIFPIWGGLSYLMFGKARFSRAERKRSNNVQFHYMRAAFRYPDAIDELRGRSAELAMQATYIRNYAGAPVYKNTQIEYFPLGEDMFARLVPELEQAKKFIFLEYFIIHPGRMWNTIEEILVRKARAGVDVRLIYDDIGCIGLLPSVFPFEMEKKGIRCCVFNRLTNIFSSRFNNRDHRKICVIDGNVGFTGGINLADEYINEGSKYGHWKDTAVMLRGEGVFGLTSLFLSMWDTERRETESFESFRGTLRTVAPGFVQPYTDSPFDSEHVGETVYRNMLNRAKNYVYITTPYLIIDDEMITALSASAKSGVDVRIITPGIPDKKVAYTLTRSYYEVLLRAGVRIYEYTPGFTHAKEFVSDDRCAVVGTINLDYRSLCHHYECAVWMCDVPVIADIKADILSTMDKCREVTLDTCHGKLLIWRVWQALLRGFAPLF